VLSLTPDRSLASGSMDGTLCLWRPQPCTRLAYFLSRQVSLLPLNPFSQPTLRLLQPGEYHTSAIHYLVNTVQFHIICWGVEGTVCMLLLLSTLGIDCKTTLHLALGIDTLSPESWFQVGLLPVAAGQPTPSRLNPTHQTLNLNPIREP